MQNVSMFRISREYSKVRRTWNIEEIFKSSIPIIERFGSNINLIVKKKSLCSHDLSAYIKVLNSVTQKWQFLSCDYVVGWITTFCAHCILSWWQSSLYRHINGWRLRKTSITSSKRQWQSTLSQIDPPLCHLFLWKTILPPMDQCQCQIFFCHSKLFHIGPSQCHLFCRQSKPPSIGSSQCHPFLW